MRTFVAFLLSAFAMAPVLAEGREADVKKLAEAEKIMTETMSAPDKGIPRELLQRAECVGVFPGVKKAAFVVGGEFGRGVFTCRQKDGSMGPPAFFTIGGGSFGWQFGGQEADLILLIMNPNGVSHLLRDRFTLGGEASATAGPVGRTASAATDVQLHAEMLSWSRSRGIFLGASLNGTVIRPHAKANQEFYGKPVSGKDILVDAAVPISAEARPFVNTLSQYSRRS
ncbi:MAG: hypothetical protein DMF49_04975 [Acidobacteria bacterium]|nr:MAG: hypothetical protein DMF49_04975 [Acidobacteriota bacterium]